VSRAIEPLRRLRQLLEDATVGQLARLEFEVESLLLLDEGSACAESVSLALSLLRRNCWNKTTKRLEMKVRLGLANSLIQLKRFDEAAVVATSIVRDPWNAGRPVFWMAARQMLCHALVGSGRIVSAMAELRRASRLLPGIGNGLQRTGFEIAKANVLHRCGNVAEGLAAMHRAVAFADAKGTPAWSAYARLLLADMQMLINRDADAVEHLIVAVAAAESTGNAATARAGRGLLEKVRHRLELRKDLSRPVKPR
jgi:hypothetical protein